ncbi:uncharacterized protein LOC100713799 isoform X2 [Cavia porcellus]|uniref:uncharacterized protein LOC100713799 isoform X2 n=1 Tax=Cavia porcellus TaxID=10141 RepID=UPI000661CB77
MRWQGKAEDSIGDSEHTSSSPTLAWNKATLALATPAQSPNQTFASQLAVGKELCKAFPKCRLGCITGQSPRLHSTIPPPYKGQCALSDLLSPALRTSCSQHGAALGLGSSVPPTTVEPKGPSLCQRHSHAHHQCHPGLADKPEATPEQLDEFREAIKCVGLSTSEILYVDWKKNKCELPEQQETKGKET